MNSVAWSASPVLGVPNVREAAEYYGDVLGLGSIRLTSFSRRRRSRGAFTRSSNGRGRGFIFRSGGSRRRREFVRRSNSTLTSTSTTLTACMRICSAAGRRCCSRRLCCRMGYGRWWRRI